MRLKEKSEHADKNKLPRNDCSWILCQWKSMPIFTSETVKLAFRDQESAESLFAGVFFFLKNRKVQPFPDQPNGKPAINRVSVRQ